MNHNELDFNECIQCAPGFRVEAGLCLVSADLDVSIIESIDPVLAVSGADILTYTVRVKNNSPWWSASGVTASVDLTLPSGVSDGPTTPSAGTSFVSPSWTIGDLASGASATLTIVLTADATTAAGTDVISLTSTITGFTGITDGDSDNNTATEFTSVKTVGTQRVIANFLARRADLITANEPNLVSRLTDQNGGGGSDAPLVFSSNNGLDNFNVAFATSGRDIGNADAGRDAAARALTLAALGLVGEAGGDVAHAATQAALGPLMAYGDDGSAGRIENGQYLAPGSGGGADLFGPGADAPSSDSGSRFDIWTEGQWAHADDETRESDFALLNLGADYLINPSLLVGVLGQIDWMDEKDATDGTAADGVGWMVGPYVVARLHQNLLFDGRVAGGQSYNHVDPLGLYTDDFDTNRWLAKGQLTGDFRMDNWRFSPHIAAIYFEENQKAYTDSLDVLIPSQTVSLGRVTFGPEASYVFMSDGLEIEPHIALTGIWDFDKAEIVDLTSGLAAGSSADIRARVEGGFSVRNDNGASLTGEAFYDGIGVDGLDMYGGSAKVSMPLN